MELAKYVKNIAAKFPSDLAVLNTSKSKGYNRICVENNI